MTDINVELANDQLALDNERLLAMSDKQLMKTLGRRHITAAQLRAELAAMNDEDLLDEYGYELGDEMTPAKLRAEIATESDEDLMHTHYVSTPEQERHYLTSWRCIDCTQWTCAEYYMVAFDLWEQAVPEQDGMICIGCLEKRVGRQLTPEDFIAAPINGPGFGDARSSRLQDRLGPRTKTGRISRRRRKPTQSSS